MSAGITLAPDLAEVARLNAWLRDALGGVDEALASDLKLCLNEAVANAIGYSGASQVQVLLNLGAKVTAELRDDGAPFDPTSAPLPDPLSNLETAAIGGFGLKLIRETASALTYTRTQGWNVLTITCSAAPKA